ncbi:citrate synthase-lysine N-methyltransferase CSKMT, mitochondrial [Ctenodactylus gundi]
MARSPSPPAPGRFLREAPPPVALANRSSEAGLGHAQDRSPAAEVPRRSCGPSGAVVAAAGVLARSALPEGGWFRGGRAGPGRDGQYVASVSWQGAGVVPLPVVRAGRRTGPGPPGAVSSGPARVAQAYFLSGLRSPPRVPIWPPPAPLPLQPVKAVRPLRLRLPCPSETVELAATVLLRPWMSVLEGGRLSADLSVPWMAALCRVPALMAGARRAWAFRSTGYLASNCLADRGLWDRLHAQARPGNAPTFDWFFEYEEIQGLLLPLLLEAPAACPLRVLDVGCGTSSLCADLYTQSPRPVDVLGVDFSPVAIAHMSSFLEGSQGLVRPVPGHPASRLHFKQADAKDLRHVAPSSSFQLVLDKGTWDAVARGGPPGADAVLSECLRVLSPEGTLVQLSDEDPDVRLPCLEQRCWGRSVIVQELGPFRGITYFAYLIKGPN